MILCKITDAELPAGVTHLGTDWQVSSTLHFDDGTVIAESINNPIFLTHMVFNNTLDVDKTYYGRARRLLSTGYTIWSNIDVFVPVDVTDILRVDNIPTAVSIPKLSTTCGDYINHAPSNFIFKADDFGVYGNATHESTDWIISDIEGNILLSSLADTTNLTTLSITPDNLVLKDNTPYLLKARFNATSKDSSQIATLVIFVNNSDRGDIVVGNFTAADSTVDNKYTLFNILNLVSCLYTVKDINGNVVFTQTVTSSNPNSVTIPANTLQPNTYYTFIAEPTIDTGSIGNRYMVLKTI